MSEQAEPINEVAKIPETTSRAPSTAFSDALKVAENGAGHEVVAVKAPVNSEKNQTAPPDFIPEELLSKEPPVKSADAAIKTALDYELPAAASAASKANFSMLKKHTLAVESEREALRAEVETLRKAPPSEQTATELKAEREARAALQERLERADFTQSPRYQQFETREADQLAGAKDFLTGAKDADGKDIDPSLIEVASRLSGAKRISVLRDAGLDAETISGITPYLATLDTIGREKKAALDNYKTESAQWRAQEQQRAEQQTTHQKAEEDRLFDSTAKTLAETIPALRKVAGQEKWNAQVDAAIAKGKNTFNGSISTPEAAEMSLRAAAQEVTERMCLAMVAKLKERDATIAKMTASQPGLGASRTAVTTGQAASPRENWNTAMAAVNNGAG